jgi:hypothetical protein
MQGLPALTLPTNIRWSPGPGEIISEVGKIESGDSVQRLQLVKRKAQSAKPLRPISRAAHELLVPPQIGEPAKCIRPFAQGSTPP